MDLMIADLATQVLDSGPDPIWMAGHGTRRIPPTGVRTCQAPRGISNFVPEEMTLRCGAGTAVDEIQELVGGRGQYVNLPVSADDSGTVGGALSEGEGDVYRLGRGFVRDCLLQATFVDGKGRVITAGGPTVKNVSGFDLCRLLVGARGRLGFLGEVILRTRPRPRTTTWWHIPVRDVDDVGAIKRRLYRPSSVLWSQGELYVCLEGDLRDIEAMRADVVNTMNRPMVETDAPDLGSFPHRWIVSPRDIASVVDDGQCLAEVGIGIVHHRRPSTNGTVELGVHRIEQRLRASFDPLDRLNGGTAHWTQDQELLRG